MSVFVSSSKLCNVYVAVPVPFGIQPVAKLMTLSLFTLVNVNAPVVATTSWWLHFSAPVVA